MLTLTNLHVSIGAIDILRGIEMELKPGTMTGLFGRNGAGKTSLLRTMMGVLAPARGDVRLDGVSLLGLPAHRRAHLGVGYMPEDRKLVPDLSCMANILIPAHAGVPVDEQRIRRIRELIPELEPLMSRRASLLSGGQQKIVALARAYVIGTRLLLLDEPTEGVAPVLAQRFSEILLCLKDTGTTILVAESDSRYARHLVDAVYELDRGIATRVVAEESAV